MNEIIDLSKPVEIAENIFWVGSIDENDPFKCHPYLLIDNDEAILFDIGTLENQDKIFEKVRSLIDIGNVTHIVLHHQDPDLCAGVTEWEWLIGREVKVVTHTRTTFLLKHYGIKSPYYCVDDHDFTLKLRSGRELQFVFTPYLHFPGAIATYDSKTKTLFSSDIFGGVSDKWSFYADETYFEQIKGFHEAYMPSKEILVYGLRQFEKLDIETIAPQHGSIIKRQYIKGLIAQMKELNCGLFIEQSYYNELTAAQDQLKEAYSIIKKDLLAAGDLQKKMLPAPAVIKGYKFSWIFRPSSFLGGDMFNYFKLDEENIGFYLLDVTGHGLPAALLSFNLSKTLLPFPVELSPLKRLIPEPPYHQTLMPASAVEEINKRFQRAKGTTQYFTMVYGMINLQTNILNILRAGHAMPIFLPKDGEAVLLEKGGLPVGMLPTVKFDKDVEQFPLNQGDRLFVYTDGITDCINTENVQFSEKRLIEFIEGNKEAPMEMMIHNLELMLVDWKGDADFVDDVSMVAIEKI
jgi:serine phosphatase RsbU (regulator of sigma subunit)